MTSSPKVLTLDIETAPLKMYAWSLWDEKMGVNQIDTEWSILAVCGKWLHEKKAMYLDARGDPRNDTELLDLVHAWLDAADIVVTQNGKSFDIKKINARLLAEGFDPYSPIRQVDTKEVAKRHFGFTSNRLEWMGKHIAAQPKSEHRKFPGFELWAQCLQDNKAAWNEMEKYNRQDVHATEALYLRMRPWVEGHPNVMTYIGGHGCPKCGSGHVQRRGTAVTQTGRYPRMQCLACGSWCRGAKTELPPESKKLLLTQ